MATSRRYHKKRVSKHSRKSRKMHGGKIDKHILGTEIENILNTIHGAKRTKDNILVYTITTTSASPSEERPEESESVTWTFNNNNSANVGKAAAYLGSFLGATRTVLEATKDNISRIYNGKVDLSELKELPVSIVLTPLRVTCNYKNGKFTTHVPDPKLNSIQFKTAIFYFYLYLQD